MKRLKIIRLKVAGEFEFDRKFDDGLHILTGTKNSCGKSLFIHLIDFALGDDGKDLGEYNILKKCTFFYAEIQINKEIMTIRRNINQIDSKIDVFHHKKIDEIIKDDKLKYEQFEMKDYQEFIFKKLTNHDYIKTIAPKSGRYKTISFSFLSNLFYLNQGVEAGQIFRYPNIIFPDYLREKIFSLYLNTQKINKSAPEVEIDKLKQDYETSLNKLNITRKFFSESVSDNNYFGELDKQKKYQSEILELKGKIDNLDTEIISLDLFSKEDQDKLIKFNREISELREEISEIEFSVREHTKLINDYREDIAKTEKNISAFNLFSKFELSNCPECGKELESEKIDSKCPLCKEEYELKKKNGKYIEKNMAFLSYLKDSLKDCLDVLDNESKQIILKNTEKEQLISKTKKIESQLRKTIDGMKNPIIEEKISLQSEISKKEQQLFEIESNIKILKGFRKEDERLEKLKRDTAVFENQILKIDQDEEDKKKEQDLMDVFRENFNSFFNNIIYPYFERGYIENNFGIEITTSKDGTRTLSQISSASDKVVVRLGLFYSIIKTAIEHDEVNHPKLLYLDSPRDQELTWDRFCSALLKYKSILDEGVEGQIFITIVVDGKNKFEGEYEKLNEHIFMNLTNKENERLLRKKINNKKD